MFKIDWEKTSVKHQLPQGTVEQMVLLAYPNKKLRSQELIDGGCANLNIKVFFEADKYPCILRVYMRDQNAAYREQKLAVLLKQTIPTPLTNYIGELNNYRFAITEFMPGISLRDLLLGDLFYDINTIMYDVGVTLANITVHEFQQSGVFDKNLNVLSRASTDNYLIFAKNCLKQKTVLSVLTPTIISKISMTFEKYGYLFPEENAKNLVHADFDPANILVNQVNGIWKVSGVLDWEFAFVGSILVDVANMLRYSHKMPHEFQDAFLNGLISKGVILPKHWRITIKLLNLVSLLDCLARADLKNQPIQCSDIRELIDCILAE